MNEFIAITAISICIIAIGFAVKIYKESPKIKKDFDGD